MKAADYRREIEALLMRNPSAEKIASIQAVEKFKDAVAKAKKASSLEKLQDALNQLRGFYQ